jgi:hypothetical protein
MAVHPSHSRRCDITDHRGHTDCPASRRLPSRPGPCRWSGSRSGAAGTRSSRQTGRCPGEHPPTHPGLVWSGRWRSRRGRRWPPPRRPGWRSRWSTTGSSPGPWAMAWPTARPARRSRPRPASRPTLASDDHRAACDQVTCSPAGAGWRQRVLRRRQDIATTNVPGKASTVKLPVEAVGRGSQYPGAAAGRPAGHEIKEHDHVA